MTILHGVIIATVVAFAAWLLLAKSQNAKITCAVIAFIGVVLLVLHYVGTIHLPN
jgi:hypothetical protein